MKLLPNILIVDDLPENLFFLRKVLRNEKINLIEALSGEEALIKTKGIELAMAIIDVRMPRMNGYQLAEKMNDERNIDRIPIIFATANCIDAKEMEKGYFSGAVDYIVKPISVHILLCKIKVFIDLFNQKQTIIHNAAILKKSSGKLNVAHASLKKSEEKYRNYVDNAPDGIFVADETGRYVEVNKAACRITGYSKEELLKMSISDVLPEESLEDGLALFRKMVKAGTSKDELMFKHKNGTTRWWILEAVKLSETRFLGFTKDITVKKMAEQALKVSEEKYKTMLNASPDGIMIIDLKGIIAEASEIGLELLGVENRNELIGKHFFKYVPTDEKIIIEEAIQKTLNEGIEQNVELKIRKKNQSLFLSEISFTLIQSPDATLFSFMITIRDISQRKKMEKMQIHADRMANLGEMASGIAHEINQPLNTLSLIIDNILYEAAKDENIKKEYLKKKSEKIFKNITRIKNIIDHIRTFSRINDDYILTGFDINSSINNAVTMISEQFKHLNINLDLQLERNPPLIIGNTFQFEQVILNLLSNARDALLEKKNIRKAHFDMLVGIRSFKENQCFLIEITDNGSGISEEDIEHIILPFYTTKDTGKGTGLGLSISYQIIKEMNGTIEIRSDKHTGTTFKIILKIQNKE